MSVAQPPVCQWLPLDLLCAEVLPRCDMDTYRAMVMVCKALHGERVVIRDTAQVPRFPDHVMMFGGHRMKTVRRTFEMCGGVYDGVVRISEVVVKGARLGTNTSVTTHYRRGLKHGPVLRYRHNILRRVENWTDGVDVGSSFKYDRRGRVMYMAECGMNGNAAKRFYTTYCYRENSSALPWKLERQTWGIRAVGSPVHVTNITYDLNGAFVECVRTVRA